MKKNKGKKRITKRKRRDIQKRVMCGALVAFTIISLVAGGISVII